MRNRLFSLINILGLAIGIGCSLLIFGVIHYETSFDTYHQKADRIYHFVLEQKAKSGVSEKTSGSPIPSGEALRNDFAQLEKVARIHWMYGTQMTVIENGQLSNRKFMEPQGVMFAEPQFFEIFDFPLLSGQVSQRPNTVVLNQRLAEKYFGDWTKAIGRSLKMDNDLTVEVSGVMANYPNNTDFAVEAAVSYKTFSARQGFYGYTTDWGNCSSNDQVFVLLKPEVTVSQVTAALPAFCKKYYPPGDIDDEVHHLVPLSENHFDQDYGMTFNGPTKRSTIWSFGLVGLLIVVMACINFINLATAQAVRRSREVGIRKVVGSTRKQLMGQFMGETILIVGMAVGIGILLAQLGQPFMHLITNLPQDIQLLGNPSTWVFLLLTALAVALLSGFYPAMVLSGFEPIKALKNRVTFQTVGGLSLRRTLVVLQFVIAQLLIIGTLIALSQMHYVRSLDLGLDKDAILIASLPPNDSLNISKYEALRNQLLQHPKVKGVSFSSDSPSSDNVWSSNFVFDNRPNDEDFNANLKIADAAYFKTYGLRFLAGAPYPDADTAKGMVINETMLHKLGLNKPEQAVGKNIRLGGGRWKQITGVVKDFKTSSVRNGVSQTLIFSLKKYYSEIAVKISPTDIDQTTAQLKNIWERTFPQYVYDAHFFDERIANFYRQEDRLTLLFRIFSGIAIFISCLGLYGLVSFMAVQRTKEIGVRKVLGASTTHIILLFSKEFILMILLAFVLAAPLAYYFMNGWLENFQFRITIGVQVFVVGVLGSLLVALLTLGYKAYQVAITNPVKSLKTD